MGGDDHDFRLVPGLHDDTAAGVLDGDHGLALYGEMLFRAVILLGGGGGRQEKESRGGGSARETRSESRWGVHCSSKVLRSVAVARRMAFC